VDWTLSGRIYRYVLEAQHGGKTIRIASRAFQVD